MDRATPVGPGTRVVLMFELSLATGEHVDGTGDKPASFVTGDGSLLPGFERAMFGLRPGEQAALEIPAREGFGEPNPENVHMLKRTDFAPDMDISVGLVVSFANPEKQELPGVVTRVLGELVEVDFNHPLSGKDLLFRVEIVSVEQVSDEIARM